MESVFGHVRSTFKYNTLVNTETLGRYGAFEDSGGMHDYFSSGVEVALDGATNDYDFSFDLRFNSGAWIDNQSVLSEYFALEMASNLNGTLEGQSPFESCAMVQYGCYMALVLVSVGGWRYF
jgi:hypothetical protein